MLIVFSLFTTSYYTGRVSRRKSLNTYKSNYSILPTVTFHQKSAVFGSFVTMKRVVCEQQLCCLFPGQALNIYSDFPWSISTCVLNYPLSPSSPPACNDFFALQPIALYNVQRVDTVKLKNSQFIKIFPLSRAFIGFTNTRNISDSFGNFNIISDEPSHMDQL